MKPSRRRLSSHALCIALFVGIGGGVPSAQRAQGPRVPQLQPESARVFPPANAHATRQELQELLQKHPPSVAQVLRLDPSLLTQPTYLETYPELAAFVAQHPEIVRDPVFFFGRGGDDGVYDNRARALNVWSDVLTGALVLLAFTAFLTAFTWVIRSAIDYRRWLRLSKIQVDVHGKLMDRLSSNEDLLAYMQSSAGRRFLEAAPIPVDSGARALSAPVCQRARCRGIGARAVRDGGCRVRARAGLHPLGCRGVHAVQTARPGRIGHPLVERRGGRPESTSMTDVTLSATWLR
jgi:hypothetical protein